MTGKHTCPCCGYKTLSQPRCWDVCPICLWEDDNVQSDEPDFYPGANKISLRQAQRNFSEFGACERRVLPCVRKPNTEDIRDPDWRPLDQLTGR
ncbi:MAG: hypothetical protein JSV65_01730 [Armatimonadota bacterium]|nr:MAG: hypothetical protein JSV65_01730 [Armatimonadota bacterium]